MMLRYTKNHTILLMNLKIAFEIYDERLKQMKLANTNDSATVCYRIHYEK